MEIAADTGTLLCSTDGSIISFDLEERASTTAAIITVREKEILPLGQKLLQAAHVLFE